VGIFDADVYGPSLPTMVSPELRILRMNPETRAITPTEYQGVQLVSFGFAGQGSAIMRGAMVSGLIQQMLTTSEWGELAGIPSSSKQQQLHVHPLLTLLLALCSKAC
jgi:Mrp family chromosome partitioning ATPase